MDLERKTIALLIGLGLILLGLCFIAAGKYLCKDISKSKDMIALSLTSRHFLFNLLIWIFNTGWVISMTYLFVNQDMHILIFIPIVVFLPIMTTLLKFTGKINTKSFDEREDLLCLRAERIAGQVTAYSCIAFLLVAKFAVLNFEAYKLLVAPFVVYHIAFNLACWYSFRKEEKEIANDLRIGA